MKKFTQKIYYGHVTETIPNLSVPCPHGEQCKVGSFSCNCCTFSVDKNTDHYYIICSRKPKLLEALEAAERFFNNVLTGNDTRTEADSVKSAIKSAIKAAYGKEEELRR